MVCKSYLITGDLLQVNLDANKSIDISSVKKKEKIHDDRSGAEA